jgi:hypothetical protein
LNLFDTKLSLIFIIIMAAAIILLGPGHFPSMPAYSDGARLPSLSVDARPAPDRLAVHLHCLNSNDHDHAGRWSLGYHHCGIPTLRLKW